jgi:quinol monooxygenase YgiN
MFVVIAIHHAAKEHDDEFVEFMHAVIEKTGDAPGLLEFKACRDPNNGFLAGFSRWENADAFQAALPTIVSLAQLRNPEWTTKPDEIITLVEA